ncbi:MAG: ABC transporter permease [Gemmatimonadales bacterium]
MPIESWLYKLPLRLRSLFRRSRVEQDLDDEILDHIERQTALNIAAGMPRDEARTAALHSFGRVALKKDEVRDARGVAFIENLMQDVRFAVRGLRRNPGFTLAAVLTFVLGLGANATIFSLIDRTLVRAPVGVGKPGDVHRVYRRSRQFGPDVHITSTFSYPELRDMRVMLPAEFGLAGYFSPDLRRNRSVCGGDEMIQVVGDYFGVLALHPALGRFFSADEQRVETVAPVAVISYACWQDHFGGDQSVLGKTIDVDNRRLTIIGVAPRGFGGTDLGQDAANIWAVGGILAAPPGDRGPWYDSPFERVIRLVFRSHAAADALRVRHAATRAIRISRGGALVDTTDAIVLAGLQSRVAPDRGDTEVTIATRLAGVAVIILLIACANVTNLLLARGVARRREFAVRLALGVSRVRLVRLLLIESVVLAAAGGMAALALGAAGGTILRNAIFSAVNWGEPVLDIRLSIFIAVLAMVAGCASGIVPAIHAVRADMHADFSASVRSGAVRKSRVRNSLLVLQTALSVVLLAGAALFVRSLENVENVNIGYDADRLVVATLPNNPMRDTAFHSALQLPAIEERLARTAGVQRFAEVQVPPLMGRALYRMSLPDRDSIEALGRFQSVNATAVSAGYFQTVGIQVKTGRGFAKTDAATSEPVVAVSASLARLLWPGESALTKCVILGKPGSPCRRVVGVVSEAHVMKILEPDEQRLYMPLAQMANTTPHGLVVRASADRVPVIVMELERMLADPNQPDAPPRVRSMTEVLAPELRPWRLGATLFSTAGLLALAVAAVGIFGSVSYTVGQRRHEMGIRAALGAGSPAILRLVVGQGVRVVVVGIIAGAALTIALGKLVASMLHGISPRDPLVLVGVGMGFFAVAALACLVPALSATRVDPTEALRAE